MPSRLQVQILLQQHRSIIGSGYRDALEAFNVFCEEISPVENVTEKCDHHWYDLHLASVSGANSLVNGRGLFFDTVGPSPRSAVQTQAYA